MIFDAELSNFFGQRYLVIALLADSREIVTYESSNHDRPATVNYANPNLSPASLVIKVMWWSTLTGFRPDGCGFSFGWCLTGNRPLSN